MDRSVHFGAYEVLFELAHGGMGAVYLARAVGGPVGIGGFERLVAIKRLHLHLTGQADSVQRFLEEATVAARIHHANVVGIHQVGGDETGHFLVQDYVEGDNLQGLVDHAILKRRRLPPPAVLRIAIDALSGLQAVHDATDAEGRPLGILHRDVAPQNLLVGKDGVTRLADFGIAKHAQSSVVTDGQYLQGRVLYMPPEYLSRQPVDRRFDVYGMGLTLFLALSGDTPWPGASEAQIVHLATTTGVPPLSSTGLTIAPAIEAVVARACHRDPEARFPTARAMLEAIEEIGRHTGWIASHAEVAALVDELAGRELAARRAAVTRARGKGAGTTPRATVVSVVEAKPRRIGRLFAAGGVVALLLATGVLTVTRRGQRAAAAVSPPAPGAAPSTPPATVPAVEPLPSGASAPPSVARSAAPPSVVAPPGGASEPPPRRAVEGRPGAVSSARRPPPAAPSDRPVAPANAGEPAVINTANPYR
jgi:serine/threonine-protein kinase